MDSALVDGRLRQEGVLGLCVMLEYRCAERETCLLSGGNGAMVALRLKALHMHGWV